MAQIINFGNELIRINTEKNTIEYSLNQGRTWFARCASSSYGDFIQLYFDGKNLMATTSKGVYYSTNEGRTWLKR